MSMTNMARYWAVIVGCMLGCGTLVHGQESLAVKPVSAGNASALPALTLAKAMDLALQRSPEVRAAQQEVKAAEAVLQQAHAYPNPELQTLLEDTRRETRSTTLQLSQQIELGGKRAARTSVARQSLMQARIVLEDTQAQLKANVTQAYFAAALAQEHRQLAQEAVDIAAKATDAAGKRVTAGKSAPLEETRAKLAMSAVKLEWIQAQADWSTSTQALSSLIGGGGEVSSLPALAWQPNEVTSEAEHRNVCQGQTARMEAAPAIRLAQGEVARWQALADLEQAKRLPDPTVIVGTKRSEELGRNQLVLGLNVPLPVWDRNQGNVLQALRQTDKAQAELDAARLRVQTQCLALNTQMQAAHTQVKALREDVLPGAQTAWQASVTGFELGKFTFIDMLDAQRTLLQARSQYLHALSAYYRAASDMDRLLGTDTTSNAPAATPVQGSQP
ncbi:MAG: TolC family protein [Acidobacteriota bacterium]